MTKYVKICKIKLYISDLLTIFKLIAYLAILDCLEKNMKMHINPVLGHNSLLNKLNKYGTHNGQ